MKSRSKQFRAKYNSSCEQFCSFVEVAKMRSFVKDEKLMVDCFIVNSSSRNYFYHVYAELDKLCSFLYVISCTEMKELAIMR